MAASLLLPAQILVILVPRGSTTYRPPPSTVLSAIAKRPRIDFNMPGNGVCGFRSKFKEISLFTGRPVPAPWGRRRRSSGMAARDSGCHERRSRSSERSR
jgi:hypothetical protein